MLKKLKEKEVSAITEGLAKKMPAMIDEAVAKYAENQKKREKDFNFTGSKKALKIAQDGEKIGAVVKFLNSFKNGDITTLQTMHADRAKTLNETTGAAGAYLVPEEFETMVMRAVNDYSVIRRNALVLPMNTDVKRLNELSGKVTAYRTDELTTITGSQPTFGEPVLTAHKYAGITALSEELYEDSEVQLLQLLAQELGEAIAKEEEDDFVNDTTSGSEGILKVSGVSAINLITGTTFSAITWDDLAAMQVKLFEDFSQTESKTAKFYMSMSVYNILRTLKATATGAYYTMPAAPNAATPASAWGLGIEVLPEFPSTTATATKFVAFTDLKRHGVIGDRRGLRLSVHAEGTVGSLNLLTQDALAIKATKRTAWVTALQKGIVTLATN